MEPIKTILVPVDFDRPSDHALDTAIRFAKNLGATITLLHVEPYKLSDVPQDLFYEDGANASGRARRSAADGLAYLIEAKAASGVPMTSVLREGIAWDAILGAARDLRAELIVMGTHGRKGLTRGVLGSVAEHVVRGAKIPVMTVRADEP